MELFCVEEIRKEKIRKDFRRGMQRGGCSIGTPSARVGLTVIT